MRWRRNLTRGCLATLPALAAASIALAATGNSVHVHAPSSVTSGHAFTVRFSGAAEGGGNAQAYLDRHKCASTANKESVQAGSYKRGKSYFVVAGEGGTSRSTVTGTYIPANVHNYHAFRQFKQSLRGHAGTHKGSEHVCAYLEPSFGKPAHAKAYYVVK